MLDENLLSGTLPSSELSTMRSLKYLSIARTYKSGPRLTGSLPAFDDVPNLESLALNGNELTGPIPSTFGSSSNRLRRIDLRDNAVTGSIPSELETHVQLDIFLAGNQITDIPTPLCLSDNWMDGAIGELLTCDAIMCAPGSYSPIGRAANESLMCSRCTETAETTSPYFGMTDCAPIVDERRILHSLFSECNGAAWHRKDFWQTQVDICNWYGVGCDRNGRVILLNLESNNVNCTTLPSYLFDLQHLEVLRLSSNPLTLRFDNIERAKRLRELRVDGTGLTSLHGVSQAKSLTVLDAGFNSLRGPMTKPMFELPNLRVLSLRDNKLSGMIPAPDSWAALKYLRILRLDNNRFTGTIPSFSDSEALSYVFLGGNALNGTLPIDLMERTPYHSSVTVDLSRNKISGTIPQELSRIERLSLYLRDNMIKGIPNGLCANPKWNDGDVENYGCDGILCPPNTVSDTGRITADSPECLPCPNGNDYYYGQSVCPKDTSAAEQISIQNLNFVTMLVVSFACFMFCVS